MLISVRSRMRWALALVLVSPVLAPAPAAALTVTTIKDQASCASLRPGTSATAGTWVAATKTCTMHGDWVAGTDNRFTIDVAVTLVVPHGLTFNNFGDFVNHGTLQVDGKFINRTSLGHGGSDSSTIVNGTLLGNGSLDQGLQVGPSGLVLVSGQLDVQVPSTISGRLISMGRTDLADDLTVTTGGIFETNNQFAFSDTGAQPDLTIDAGGTLNVNSSAESGSGVTLINNGMVRLGGNWQNNGSMTNNGFFCGPGAITGSPLTGTPQQETCADPETGTVDLQAPALESFEFSPQSINVGNGVQTVTVTAHVTDVSGAQSPVAEIVSSNSYRSIGTGPMTLVAGSTVDGIWQREIVVPTTAEAGTWTVSVFPLADAAGNTERSFHAAPAGLTIVTTPDQVPSAVAKPDAVRGDQSAGIAWNAASGNGSPVTGYTVTSSPESKTCTTEGALTCEVVGLANGTAYTFTVTATNSVGTSAPSPASDPVTPAAVPSAPAKPSAVRGNAQATVSWSAPASNGSAITGYAVTASPGGDTCTTEGALSCMVTGLSNGTAYTFTVTATNSVGTSTPSPASDPVIPTATSTFTTVGTPSVVGTARVGVRLTATPGTWDPLPTYGYQWKANGVAIFGATASTFTPTSALLGKQISVTVAAAKSGYESVNATSTPTAVVLKGIIRNGALPSIAGTRKVGYTLTAKNGTWSPSGLSYRYQWFRNGKVISGATAKTYKLTSISRGKRISVVVVASRTGYTTLKKSSAATGYIQ